MPVFLSPGVFTQEVDLGVLPGAVGPLRPAFIGTAKKGPLNKAVLITSAQQFIDTFGEPFSSSYLGYAVLAYLEEGNECYVVRVGVECQDGQVAALSSVCIDTSGLKRQGWGRIPVFSGIDFGRIDLRIPSSTAKYDFHPAQILDRTFTEAVASTGTTTASIAVTGTYDRDVDDSYIVTITRAPNISDAAKISGAQFTVVRNSDNATVASGTFQEPTNNGVSQVVAIGDGLSIQVTVTAGRLNVGDTFTFRARPDNRVFKISVENAVPTSYTMPTATYQTVADFVAAFNALLSNEGFVAIAYTASNGTVNPQIRTTVAGRWIQIRGTSAWAREVGQQLWAFDIPRSFLLGTVAGPYNINTANNRVVITAVGESGSVTLTATLATGTAEPVTQVAGALDSAGVVGTTRYLNALTLNVPGGTAPVTSPLQRLLLLTTTDRQLDVLVMQASYTNLKTLNFATTVGIAFPYKRGYRGFTDVRTWLPQGGPVDPAVPLSCVSDPLGSTCAADSSYYGNIVGFLVATSPGTWLNGYTVTLDLFTEGVGDSSGRYKITLRDASGAVVDIVQDVSFDTRAERYIANVVNPGSTFGGTNGNAFYNWEARPAYLNNDPVNAPASYAVRKPSLFANRPFAGMANGIPTDPAYSSSLDAAVIGNPVTSTGLQIFQNPESIDTNLLVTPGFSSGAVIGQALQLCEARGDMLYLVDPPFGLRPQQVIDWHNGMLLSDLRSAINSSYGALYWSWVKVFDQFARQDIWIPPSGHISAVFSRTARVAEQWFAPAGLRRGRLLTARELEYSPTQGERNVLYSGGNAVNAIVAFPQQGIVVWGDRTLQRKESPLDRVPVRMLLIFLKKNLIRLLRDFIFEPNDKILWAQVKNVIDPFISDIQARRGLTGFKTVVDESNNTPERIDRNELWVSVFIKPTRTAEFVNLNLVVLRTGASFSADEVLAAGGIISR